MEGSDGEKPRKNTGVASVALFSVAGVVAGVLLGNYGIDKINEKRDLKKIVGDAAIICNEENNVYELKRTFEPGEHQISYSYLRTVDSLGVLDIPNL